jgi:carbon storage regulator
VLVFTRRKGETIMIGDGVAIEVLRIGRDGVRLGVVAPPEIAVHRKEIYDQIREANQKAAAPPSNLDSLAQRLKRA